jgi:hypothetical protein
MLAIPTEAAPNVPMFLLSLANYFLFLQD